MSSFDVLSTVDLQEVVNAVDQAKREIGNRYDFKGSKSELVLEGNAVKILADDQMKLKAVQEILKTKLAKRGVSLKSVKFENPVPAGGDMLKQAAQIKQGLTSDELKKMVKIVKGKKFKVNAQIQGDQLRVSGKKRDELQEVIAYLKTELKDLELQFENFRD